MTKHGLRPTPHQLKMLNLLDREDGPVDEHVLNGRVAKALLARRWASQDDAGVQISELGQEILREFLF
jgi:hypothetical protein